MTIQNFNFPLLPQNRFLEGEEKPEVLDDWDQRLVVSRLEKELDGRGLRLTQLAHRDQVNGVEKSRS